MGSRELLHLHKNITQQIFTISSTEQKKYTNTIRGFYEYFLVGILNHPSGVAYVAQVLSGICCQGLRASRI